MTLKNKLNKARGDHYKKHDVIIKNSHVARMLWPESPNGSKRSLLSTAMKNDLDLKASQIRILISIFPETTSDYWIK